MRPRSVGPHTGWMTPVATASAGSAMKAARTAAMAPGSSRVSPSTVSTMSACTSGSAVLSATALPPCGRRSQRSSDCGPPAGLQLPGGGGARP